MKTNVCLISSLRKPFRSLLLLILIGLISFGFITKAVEYILVQTQTALAFPREIAGRILTTFNLVMFTGAFSIQWGIGLLVDLFQSTGIARGHSLMLAFLCLVVMQVFSLLWFFIRRPVVVEKD